MTRRAPPGGPATDHRDIPLQIKQHLDASSYRLLAAAFTACEQAGEAAGYARAMRDCTSALCKVQTREHRLLAAEIITAAVLIAAAVLWVAMDFRTLVCGM